MTDEPSRTAAVGGTDQPPHKRFGCLFYAFLLLLLPVLLVLIGFQLWYSRAMTELADEMQRIAARGEPLWFSDLAPAPPEPGENGTGLFLSAIEKFVRPSQAFNELLDPSKKTPPGRYEPFAITLDENRTALELMRQAVRRPFFRLPLDYNTKQPISILLEPIQHARDFSLLLKAEALHAVGENDNDRALAAILDALLLSEMLRDEPLLITQLVRIAIAQDAVNSLETILAHIDLTPEQFGTIDDQLALMESRFRLAPAVIGERAMALTTVHHLGENLQVVGDSGDSVTAMRILSSGPAKPYRMNDEAFLIRIMTRFVDEIDRTGPDATDAIRQVNGDIIAAKVGYRHVMTCLLAPAVLNCREAGLRHRQRLASARLGLRLARFNAEHGRLPETLDAVTDATFPTVPADLLSGKPIIYRVLTTGFTIYPVGENGIDDGGGEEPDRQEHSAKFEVRFEQVRGQGSEGRSQKSEVRGQSHRDTDL